MGLFQRFKHLCGADGQATGFDGPERRCSQRYASVPNEAEICWSHGTSQVHAYGNVCNVSSNGVLIQCDRMPQSRQWVWIRINAPSHTEWYQAQVTRISGPKEFALNFAGPCPYELFKAARGVREDEHMMSPHASEFDTRDWH